MKEDRKSRRRTGWISIWVALWMALAPLGAGAEPYRDGYHEERDRGGYTFATTRGLTEMDVHPALKVPVLPFAIVLDVIFLPFALIADMAT